MKRRRTEGCFHGLVKVLIMLAHRDTLGNTQRALASAFPQTECSFKPIKRKGTGGRKSRITEQKNNAVVSQKSCQNTHARALALNI